MKKTIIISIFVIISNIMFSAEHYRPYSVIYVHGYSNQKNEIINQIYSQDQNKMLSELTQKKEFKVESYANNKATVSYKETSVLDGVQNVRMGIDMETGNILFIEQKSNMINGTVLLEYVQGEIVPKKIISTSSNDMGNSIIQICLKNTKININIKESVFSTK